MIADFENSQSTYMGTLTSSNVEPASTPTLKHQKSFRNNLKTPRPTGKVVFGGRRSRLGSVRYMESNLYRLMYRLAFRGPPYELSVQRSHDDRECVQPDL